LHPDYAAFVRRSFTNIQDGFILPHKQKGRNDFTDECFSVQLKQKCHLQAQGKCTETPHGSYIWSLKGSHNSTLSRSAGIDGGGNVLNR
jgi:hypothetical protein